MICRKDLTECRTPGMYSPHGGCTAGATDMQWFDVCRALADERDQLKAENEALRKDSERLNWLDGRMSPVIENQNYGQPEGELVGYDWGIFGQCGSVREAIDDAMSKDVDH